MKTYTVDVTRTTYADAYFEVDAESRAEAEAKALQKAYDHSWSCREAEYDVTNVEEPK